MMEIDLPAVPNWLNWVAVILGIIAIAVVLLGWLWRRFVADWLASRGEDLARAQAVKIIKMANRVKQDRDNIPRLIYNATRGLLFVILGTLAVAIGTNVLLIGVAVEFLGTAKEGSLVVELPDDIRRILRHLPSIILTFAGYGLMIRGAQHIRDWVLPHADYAKYAVRTGQRIVKLFNSAGIPEHERVEFIEEHWPTNGDEDDDPEIGPITEAYK